MAVSCAFLTVFQRPSCFFSCLDLFLHSLVTGAATVASGANYLLVSGLTPRGRLGRQFMVQRARIQKRYRQRELAMQEGIVLRRDQMRAKGVSNEVERRE